MNIFSSSGWMLAITILALQTASAQIPDPIAVPGIAFATIHAEGAQLYECKANASRKLTWEFREPIATLIADGQTVGRHYAGPTWEFADGSAISGKVVGRAPGATPQDIPLLELEVISRRATGQFANVTTIRRLNTKGGVADGPCAVAGGFLSVPYSADYAFFE